MSRGVHLATNVPKISLQEAIGSTVGTLEGSAGQAVTKVRDQHGSTAGAGSGALAVYRKHRRVEMTRLEEMARQDKVEEMKEARLQKIKENKALDEEEALRRKKRRRKTRATPGAARDDPSEDKAEVEESLELGEPDALDEEIQRLERELQQQSE